MVKRTASSSSKKEGKRDKLKEIVKRTASSSSKREGNSGTLNEYMLYMLINGSR